MQSHRSVLWFGLAAFGLLAGICIIYVYTRSRAPNTRVHFILPNGFRGLFAIQLTQQDPPTNPTQDGRFVYRIPSSGLFRASDHEPVLHWHVLSAEFADGTPLPVEHRTAKDSLQLYSLSTDEHGNSYYLVGTAEDKERFYRTQDRTLGHVSVEERH